jgi:hypothetical protein
MNIGDLAIGDGRSIGDGQSAIIRSPIAQSPSSGVGSARRERQA